MCFSKLHLGTQIFKIVLLIKNEFYLSVVIHVVTLKYYTNIMTCIHNSCELVFWSLRVCTCRVECRAVWAGMDRDSGVKEEPMESSVTETYAQLTTVHYRIMGWAGGLRVLRSAT